VELFPIPAFLISENKIHRIKNLFKLFVSFLKDADLIAGNHCYRWYKSRAHNSKKANFNQKIDRHLAYIEEKTKNT
jgi:hypothetical protein